MIDSIFYLLCVLAIGITLVMGMDKNILGLTLFASSPYLMLLYVLKIAKHHTARITARTVTLFIISVGLYFLLDTTYMQRHLEHKFSFFFIPLWQWTMLIVSGCVVYFSNDKVFDVSD